MTIDLAGPGTPTSVTQSRGGRGWLRLAVWPREGGDRNRSPARAHSQPEQAGLQNPGGPLGGTLLAAGRLRDQPDSGDASGPVWPPSSLAAPLYSCAISCNSLSSLILFIESSLSVLVNLAHVLPINSSSVSLMASVSLSALVSGASLLWALFVLFWLLEA